MITLLICLVVAFAFMVAGYFIFNYYSNTRYYGNTTGQALGFTLMTGGLAAVFIIIINMVKLILAS